MLPVIVLCAGLGTRLLPLTRTRPKPLLPVGDRPALLHIASALSEWGLDSAVVNVHHLTGIFLNELKQLPFRFQVVTEPEIRGTAGGIAGARPLLGDGPAVAWVGDVLARPDLGGLVARVGTDGLCLAVAPRPVGQGTVGRDAYGHVVRLRGERFGVEVCGGDYIGICALGRGVLEAMPERGCLVGDVMLPALRRGELIATMDHHGGWSEIGDLERYLAANLGWLSEHAQGGSWVAQDGRVDPDVRLDGCVVGRGARVQGCGLLRHCVLWPGTRAVAPLSDAIVTEEGALRAGAG